MPSHHIRGQTGEVDREVPLLIHHLVTDVIGIIIQMTGIITIEIVEMRMIVALVKIDIVLGATEATAAKALVVMSVAAVV